MVNPGRPRKHDPRADAIRQAIKFGPEAQAKELIDKTGNDITDGEGRTPLFYAVDYCSEALVEWLLSRGAEVNHQDRWGAAPIHYAVDRGLPLLIDSLLIKGADPNLVDKHGNGALWHATRSACRTDATEQNFLVLQSLLRHGADPNHLNAHNRSPRCWAESSPRVAEALSKFSRSS